MNLILRKRSRKGGSLWITRQCTSCHTGFFVLTAKDEVKANGCITNTAIQVTSEPNQISFAVNKANYTHDMVLKTKKAIISVIS